MAARGGHWSKSSGGGSSFVAASGGASDDPYGALPGMTAAEAASAEDDNYGLPQAKLTPAGQRASEAMSAAAAGPGGMMSPEFKASYKQSAALGETQSLSARRINSVQSSHSSIERNAGSTRRSAARSVQSGQANLARIQREVGAGSTNRDALIRAIRLQFIRDTR